MKSSTLSGRGDEIIAAGGLLAANSKVITVRARMADRSVAGSMDTVIPANKVITGKRHVATKITGITKIIDIEDSTSG